MQKPFSSAFKKKSKCDNFKRFCVDFVLKCGWIICRPVVSSQPHLPSPQIADEAGGFDLIGSIMMGQSMMAMKGEDFTIKRDGECALLFKCFVFINLEYNGKNISSYLDVHS